jgi:hypothetical protein
MRGMALLPAYLSTLISIGLSVLGAFASVANGMSAMSWLAAASICAYYLFLTVWLQGAFLIAEETRPTQVRRPLLNWLPFVSPALVVAALSFGGQSALAKLSGVAGLLIYFALTFRAAAALVRAEGKVSGGVPAFNAVFVAWLGLLYFPIGVWFLRPRLARLSAGRYTVGGIE